jgi:hypothetical protein
MAPNHYGFEVLCVSVLLIEPSGCSVTVFSFVLTEPSLRTWLVSVCATVRSQPTANKDSANADKTDITTSLRFCVFGFILERTAHEGQGIGAKPVRMSQILSVDEK